MSKKRFQFTANRQLAEAILSLLRTGLYGRTSSEVVERLVCAGVLAAIEKGAIRDPRPDEVNTIADFIKPAEKGFV